MRPERQTNPMAGGRLCEICREGDPPGEPLRWDHHGPPVIRPGTERRDLEDRGEDFSACSALYKDFVEKPLIFSDQFLYDRTSAGCAFLYAGNGSQIKVRRESDGR